MRVRLAAVVLLLAAPAAARVAPFPRAAEVFHHLLAEPRQPRLSASYHRLGARDQAELGLGGAAGLARWRTGDQSLLWQLEAEGLAYGRLGAEGTDPWDLLLALLLSMRRGDVSFKGSLFQESEQGFERPAHGLRLLSALEPYPWLRVYGGGSRRLNAATGPGRGALQAGAELVSRALGRGGWRLFLAQDLQWRERAEWGVDARTVAGVSLGRARAQLAYYAGRSSFARLSSRTERYFELGAAFGL